MKRIVTTCSSLAFMTVAAFADMPQQSVVKTHPSQGEVTVVQDATAQLLVHDEGLFVSLDTQNLTPDHVPVALIAIETAPGLGTPVGPREHEKLVLVRRVAEPNQVLR